MKIKTQDLTGPALDWAVLEALKPDLKHPERAGVSTFGPLFGKGYKYPSWGATKYAPSRDWKEGGPIIERERIQLRDHKDIDGHWTAMTHVIDGGMVLRSIFEDGPTPLVAAMRAYVASKMGDDIDVPNELV